MKMIAILITVFSIQGFATTSSNTNVTTESNTGANVGVATGAISTIGASTKADDTKMNERDRSAGELTADQQNQSPSDLNITRRIRQDVMKESNFSTYAQNVKIITVNGTVTLKGPVRTERESDRIMTHARSAAGPSNVVNQMSVVTE